MNTVRKSATLAALLFARSVAAQSSGIRTYCNPLDIDYKYNFEQVNEGISYRSGADPVIINHRGDYYLFVTVSGGYWHSKDLLHWRFVTPSRWPFEDIVAPAAVSVGDTVLLMMSSFSQRPILYSTHPASGRLEYYNRLLPPLPNYSADSLPGRPGAAGPWDPALFRDPRPPTGLTAHRDGDARNAFLSWEAVRGAVGYNVRWGIGPRKLYQTYQVFADRPLPLEIRALTVGQDYWFAVEAFDENGVSKVSEPVLVP